MKEVFVTGDNIISSLGFTSAENFGSIKNGTIGIRHHDGESLTPVPTPLSMIGTARLEEDFAAVQTSLGKETSPATYTRLEKMLILSVHDATKDLPIDLRSKEVLFILSTTKGNIQLLEEKYRLIYDHKRIFLWELARVTAAFFGFSRPPLIVSNACISGVVAIMIGSRQIRSGNARHVIVAGGDILSEFVISGFQSFQSLSPEPCKPYDINRNGLSLGEAAGTVVLSEDRPGNQVAIRVLEGAVSNDANHISGPSRTGEELGMAMVSAMERSGLDPSGIGLISAHGTATPYNDEMESKAVSYARLNHVPLNSLKGYWGHTLGAAGVIESVASVRGMMEDTVPGTAGFTASGVPEPVNVTAQTFTAPVKACIKTASGFGGCNAALIFARES